MFGSLLTGTAFSTDRDDAAAFGDDLDAAEDGSASHADAVERLLWAVVIASVGLDVFTTYLGLSAGLSEGNPVMRWAISDIGFVALAAAKFLVVAAALGFRKLRPKYGTTIALGLALPWTVTVLVNAAVLATL